MRNRPVEAPDGVDIQRVSRLDANSVDRAAAELASVARRLGQSGLTPGTSGNLSCRIDEETFLITPSGMRYQDINSEDMVVVEFGKDSKLDGRRVRRPSTEVAMHAAVLRSRPETSWIIHTHAPHSTALACLGEGLPPFHYMLITCSHTGDVGVVPYCTYGTDELGALVAAHLGSERNACLLESHGNLVLGSTASEAFDRLETLEWACGVFIELRAVGAPHVLASGEIARIREKLGHYGQEPPTPVERGS